MIYLITSELLSHVNVKGQNTIKNSRNKNIIDIFNSFYSNIEYNNLILNNNLSNENQIK